MLSKDSTTELCSQPPIIFLILAFVNKDDDEDNGLVFFNVS